MQIKYIAKTDLGLHREVNQDNFANGKINNSYIFIIADGLGHPEGGRFASRTAVEYIKNAFLKMYPEDPAEFFYDIFSKVNGIILREKIQNYNREMMASTCVAVIVKDEKAYLANVGDSRAYLFHNRRLDQLTKDQSLVQSMVDEGRITEEEARNHVMKNVVTEALGTRGKLNVDIYQDSIHLEVGDTLLICTDGLWGMVPDEELEKIIKSNSIDDAGNKLIQLAKDSGGHDNITLQLIHVE
jgi:protein phosphatase